MVKIQTRADYNNQFQNLQNWPEIYTDRSKLDGKVGAGIHSTSVAMKSQFASLNTAAFSKQKYVLSMKLLTG